MTHPAPTRSALAAFCTKEGWTLVLNARGKPVQHHRTYELRLPDGAVLRTRISNPVNGDRFGPSLWAHILRDEIQITEEEFWDCVDRDVIPKRSAPAAPKQGLPVALVMELRRRLHLSDAEISGLDRDEAGRRIAAYWRGSGDDPSGPLARK